ncbi:hypothetical protein E1B28_002040 [Marasmius oreades]|uniref:Uncharacterized protein n=1 Tax=Marasmius oreades TaxID=181124 RepID=A0A9P7V548_9AGAR|nr:uncharacterized protein E1B28_002040 [Marasmius oreades]KAG7100267.1 hypothetical protein E1B28_002040 [Marasmius oreades]
MATHYHEPQPLQRKSFDSDVYVRSQPRSYQADLDVERLNVGPRNSSRLKTSRSGATLKTMNFSDMRTSATADASNDISDGKKGSLGLKRKMSTFFSRRRDLTQVVEGDGVPGCVSMPSHPKKKVGEGDDVPGCMPMASLSKKKSLAFSTKAPAKEPRTTDEHQSHFRRLRTQSASSKATLTVLINSTTATTSIDSSITDESDPVATPQTTRAMSPPSLPSPGFSKDNSELWYTSLMQHFDQHKREVRRSRSFSGFRNTVSSWDLEDMIPDGRFPWQPGFGLGEGEEDYGVTESNTFVSFEEDAESVYRACEEMGGTGIAF